MEDESHAPNPEGLQFEKTRDQTWRSEEHHLLEEGKAMGRDADQGCQQGAAAEVGDEGRRQGEEPRNVSRRKWETSE